MKVKITALLAALALLLGLAAGCSLRAGVGTTPTPRTASNIIQSANV